MFKLIGTNSIVEMWDQEYEIPVMLQNELLNLENGHTMYALGDPVIGWGFLIIESSARDLGVDTSVLRDLQQKYSEVKRNTPSSARRAPSPSITQH